MSDAVTTIRFTTDPQTAPEALAELYKRGVRPEDNVLVVCDGRRKPAYAYVPTERAECLT